MAYTVSAALLTAASSTGRSTTTPFGYLPGRSFTVATAGFTGTVTPQTSTDGGLTWTNCQYENANGVISTGNLSYTLDTGTYQFWVVGPNALFSLNVGAASAGTVSATYFASDTASTLPTLTAQVSHAASTTGGATLAKLRDLKATVTAVKTTAGTLYGLHVVNNTAAACFVQIFNVATGSVTLGTTTPDLEFQVAANTSLYPTFPAVGVAFTAAISAASTTLEGGSVASATGVQVNAMYA